MKVLISDKTSSVCEKILKENGIEVDTKTGLSEDELVNIIKDYNGLVVRSATKVTKKIIDAADNLKVIGRAGAGVDNIDVEAATAKKIYVLNTPGGNSNAVVELAVGFLFSLARRIPQAHATMKEGLWEKKKFKGAELAGKTIGVLGLGKIGMNVALIAKGLKMEVLGYDPYLSDEKFNEAGIKKASLDEIYEKSDYITLHLPVTEETKHLINASVISRMKDGVKIVNCARGAVVKTDDLIEALKSGKVSAAALDVYEKEPLDGASELLKLDNVVLTPHIGASTDEAQVKVAEMIADQFSEFFNNNKVIFPVNKF